MVILSLGDLYEEVYYFYYNNGILSTLFLQLTFKVMLIRIANYIDKPNDLNSKDLMKYIEKNYDNADVNYFCTYYLVMS